MPVVLTAAAVWLGGVARGQSDDQAFLDLRPHFVQGRVSTYRVWSLRQQTQKVTANEHSQSFDTHLELEGEITWTVRRVRSNGSATCVMTLLWMTSTSTGPDGATQHTDSRRSSGKPASLHKLLRAITGVPVTVDVGPDGSVLSATGIGAIGRKVPQGTTVPDALDFMESASDLATISGAKAKSTLGDQWVVSYRWNHPLGKLRQTMRYNLQTVEDIAEIPVATVTGTARLKLDADPLPAPPGVGGRSQARLIDGDVQTQVMFDLHRHEAIGRNTLEHRLVKIDLRWPKHTITRTIDEHIHSQVIRIAER